MTGYAPMSSTVHPDGADPNSYRGLPSIFEYVNGDGILHKFNCGQAAACTFLTHYRVFPDQIDSTAAHAIISTIETEHPPDNLGGWFGASRRRVERICRTHGKPVEEIEGEAELRKRLATMQPVIVMVGTEGPAVLKWHAPAGHWMVAFGYDDRQIYLTNGAAPGMPWEEFREWWGSFVPRLISMRNAGLSAVDQSA